MAIGKFIDHTVEEKKESKKATNKNYFSDSINDEEFNREWEEACNLYREGIVTWSKKWCREWNATRKAIIASPTERKKEIMETWKLQKSNCKK